MNVAPFTLVSDLDDTIKISHTTQPLRTVFRGLFTYQAYAGMAELYRQWIGTERGFLLISSSPVWIRAKIERFLGKHGFPRTEIWLRDWLRQKDIRKYKQDQFHRVSTDFPGPYIFVGDDSEWDPEVFSKFSEHHPGTVSRIYIRRMRGRPLPEGVLGFHLAFEVAVQEWREGRLSLEQVRVIGEATLRERNLDYWIPYFAVCPGEIKMPDLPAELVSILERLNEKILVLQAKHQDRLDPL